MKNLKRGFIFADLGLYIVIAATIWHIGGDVYRHFVKEDHYGKVLVQVQSDLTQLSGAFTQFFELEGADVRRASLKSLVKAGLYTETPATPGKNVPQMWEKQQVSDYRSYRHLEKFDATGDGVPDLFIALRGVSDQFCKDFNALNDGDANIPHGPQQGTAPQCFLYANSKGINENFAGQFVKTPKAKMFRR